MTKRTFAEKMRLANNTKCTFSKEISSEKIIMANGKFAYVFRHVELGELGRLIIIPTPAGQSQLCFEVVGDEDDPMTEKRKKLLKPIVDEVSQKMDSICGPSEPEKKIEYKSTPPRNMVKSEMFSCKKCGDPAGLFIYADDAVTADKLEDYARLMFSKVKAFNVPAWVVGREKEIVINGEFAGESLVLKIWPKREKAKVVNSIDLNSVIDKLMNSHCSKKSRTSRH